MKTNRTETPNISKITNVFRWVITLSLLATAVIGNYIYNGEVSALIRAIGVVVLISCALFVASKTTEGEAAISFTRESNMEIRKVIWPTRQENIQVTLIVLAVSIVMALMLWGIDGIMVRLVTLVTEM
ncbi:preprotein translocase subunit [Candidatus Photodesmus blepharus]|uniref:Protein translocase subunit SecE n=1 Tax=Candidatus Photodesmus blepharonis TaxID=1179155 RepID=A0A084CNH1_9GAMM|nr:preprotein translocase subunit SecE [Candidatus Photodesmus blepharus]KEY91350.1 preprotein translocase subunit [Candidatus Photodesmus blepharus]